MPLRQRQEVQMLLLEDRPLFLGTTRTAIPLPVRARLRFRECVSPPTSLKTLLSDDDADLWYDWKELHLDAPLTTYLPDFPATVEPVWKDW